MRNQLFVFLVVLIFSISLNQGEKLKANDRRASGLISFPRIGRSDLPNSNLNFNRHLDMESDPDFQLYSADLDSASDKDYDGFLGRSVNLKHMEKIPREVAWLTPDRLRSAKDFRQWQKIDDGRSLYPNTLLLTRGSRNSQINGYTPRLGRENDVDRSLCK